MYVVTMAYMSTTCITGFRCIFAFTDLNVQVYLCHKNLPVSMKSQVGVSNHVDAC